MSNLDKNDSTINEDSSSLRPGNSSKIELSLWASQTSGAADFDGVYRQLFNSIDEGFCVMELILNEEDEIEDLIFRDVNPAFESKTGLSDVAGKTVAELLPNFEQSWIDACSKVSKSGESVRAENYVQGMDRWYSVCFSSISGEAGRYAAVVLDDITERKRTEEKLLESEARYRGLATASTDVIYRMNPDWSGMYRLEGKGFVPDTDQSNEKWIDKYIPDVDRRRVSAIVNKVIRNKKPFELEHRVIQRDGSVGWAFSRAVPLTDSNGEIIEWFGMAADITERKQREANQTLLIEITENLTHLITPDEIMWAVGSRLSKYLNLDACVFVDVDEEQEEVTAYHGWQKKDVSSLKKQTFRFDDYVTEEYARAQRAGEVFLIRDTATDERAEAKRYANMKIGALLTVPFHRKGRWTACLVITDPAPRDWQSNEIELVQEIVNCVFPRIERARAEEALRESEEKYRTLFNSIDEGFCLVEVIRDENDRAVDMRYLEVNEVFERQTGLHDAAGKTHADLQLGTEQGWFEKYGQVARTGVPMRFESYHEPTQRWYNIFVSRVNSSNDDRVALVFDDISERKQKERSNARLAAIVDGSDDAIISKDLNGIITSWNKAAERMFGYTAGEVIGQSIIVIVPSERFDEEDEILATIRRGERIDHFETVRKRKDGTRLDVSLTISPIQNSEGRITGASKIARDITLHKKEERLRKEQNRLLELIAESASLETCLTALCKVVPQLSTGVRVSILLANEACEKFYRAIAPDLRASWGQWLEGALINDMMIGTCSEAVFRGEAVACEDVSGDDRWSKEWRELCVANGILACHSRPIRGEKGNPCGSFMLCFDEPRAPNTWEERLSAFGSYIAGIAMEQDRSYHTLQENEERKTFLLKLSDRLRAEQEPDAIGALATRMLGRYMYADRCYIARLSREQDLCLIDSEYYSSGLAPTAGEYHFADFPESIRQLETDSLIIHDLWNDDSLSELDKQSIDAMGMNSVFVAVLYKGEGNFVWALVVGNSTPHSWSDRDQTLIRNAAERIWARIERARAEEEIQAMNETLEDRVQKRTKTLISYQKKLQMLVAQLSKAEENERRRLATNLHDNLGQILAACKMEIDLMQMKDDPASIEKVSTFLDEAISYARELMMNLKPPPSLGKWNINTNIKWVADKMKRHHLDVTFNEREIQPGTLDENVQITLVQCLEELLFNVVKHADTDRARVRLSYPEDKVRIVVEDDGNGFDPDLKEFEMSDEGGFGLFNISERIDILGGTMDIQSKPGNGTRISLTVPLENKGAESLAGQKPEEKNKSDQQFSPIKILLVDDHEMMREGLLKVIESENDLTVIGEASDAENLVSLAREVRPDVVIMDINLPGSINGIDATQKIRSALPEIQVIGLSLYDDEQVAKNMQDAGAAAYLTKTEASETLCATIRSVASDNDVGGGKYLF